MKRFHISFTVVCPITLEHKHHDSRVIEAETPELAVILARNDLMQSSGIWGKAIDIRWHQL